MTCKFRMTARWTLGVALLIASLFAAKPCAYSSSAAAFQALRVSVGVPTTRAGALYDNAATLKALGHLRSTYDAFTPANPG